MCKCTPSIRTPYCGKLGCEWPTPSGKPSMTVKKETYVLKKDTPEELLAEIEALKCQIDMLSRTLIGLENSHTPVPGAIAMVKEDIRDMKLDLIILQTTRL